MRLALAVSLFITTAACGRGASDNVMSAETNDLSPEQVDAALGPELDTVANGMNPAPLPDSSAPASTVGEDQAPSADSRAESPPETQRRPEPEPEDEEPVIDETATVTNISED